MGINRDCKEDVQEVSSTFLRVYRGLRLLYAAARCGPTLLTLYSIQDILRELCEHSQYLCLPLMKFRQQIGASHLPQVRERPECSHQ